MKRLSHIAVVAQNLQGGGKIVLGCPANQSGGAFRSQFPAMHRAIVVNVVEHKKLGFSLSTAATPTAVCRQSLNSCGPAAFPLTSRLSIFAILTVPRCCARFPTNSTKTCRSSHSQSRACLCTTVSAELSRWARILTTRNTEVVLSTFGSSLRVKLSPTSATHKPNVNSKCALIATRKEKQDSHV